MENINIKLEDIKERLYLLLNEEYTCTQLNSFTGINCDFTVDELENDIVSVEDASILIFNKLL